jgi:hypothetical protein
MTERKPFGLWTLFVAIAWAAGTVLAIMLVWHLWTNAPR